VGSYARKTAIQIGDQLDIDLAISMPASIFQEKDYLNYRYFHKRAYYLACIAAGIEEDKESSFAIAFACQNDNTLQPVIIVNPGQGADDFSESKCRIRIILAVDGDVFPISKTSSAKNCVRAKVDSEGNVGSPTPFYNASLRSECSSLNYLKYLHGASLKSDAFTDACILGSIWLRQRGLGTNLNNGGFGSFEWSVSMALLMQGGSRKGKPILSKGYSSYQLFKATLQYLSATDLVASPAIVHSDGTTISSNDHPVLFDGGRSMNVLFKMTPWSYAMLRHEASRTLKLLSDPLSDQFDACFITKIGDPVQKFDCVISLPNGRLRSPVSLSTDAIANDIAICHRLYQALKTGLNDRITLLYLKPREKHAWPLGKSHESTKHDQGVQIGLLLNPEHVNRSVDRGPSAEDKEAAAEFRKFWGGKAELRRFKDGSIQESLIWSSSDPQDSILKQIVTYIVGRHMSEEAAGALYFVGQSFDHLLPNQRTAASDPVALYQPALDAFGTLEKEIRSLEGLPLQIRQISPADPQLRYASMKAPILNPAQCQMQPANLCVQFEGSARWPDDLSAVQRTKIAFLLKMGELLEELTTGLSARLGLENTNHKLPNKAFLDIIYPSGAFFRLRIHHEGELNLLERTLKDKSHTVASREETATALSTYKRAFIQAPLHTQAVRALSTRFPLLSPSMRLMKKWRDSHLLSHHISDELIELLTIRTFAHPYPWSVPGSVMIGFLRTLTFVSKWDWRSAPLIVDFNGEMSSPDIDAISLRFEAWRKIDPAMNRVAMFAATNFDPDGITWTEPGPSKVVAARFTSLAKTACALVKEQGLGIEPPELFAASMADYDFMIHLSKKFVGDRQGRDRTTQPVFKNLQIQEQEDRSLVGFNPVQSYLNELRSLYGSNVLFFNSEQGGSVIGGLWNPQTGTRPWKVNLQYSTMPIVQSGDEGAQIRLNKNATLHDIARLGGDMVSHIEVGS